MDKLIFKLILLASIRGWGIKGEGTCSDITITLLKHESHKYKGFTDDMEKKFKDCEDSACLFINDSTDTKLYKVCKCSSEDGGEDATKPIVRTTIATPVPTARSKVKETRTCDGLAIGLLVFGMVLGSVTMTIVCVCVPQLHRNATRCLNRRAIINRQSQAAVMPGTIAPTQQHPERQVVQNSLSNDRLPQVEPSEYQSIDEINEERAHVYSDLHGQHAIYNEPDETSTSVNLIKHANNEDNTEGVKERSNSNIPRNADTHNSTAACVEYAILEPQNDLVDGRVTRNTRAYEKDYEEDGYLQPKSKTNSKGENVEPTYFVLEPEQNSELQLKQ